MLKVPDYQVIGHVATDAQLGPLSPLPGSNKTTSTSSSKTSPPTSPPPSIADFKIYSRTWSPLDPEPYFQKCVKKDRETSSLALGFHISGLQMIVGESLAKFDRVEVTKYGVDDVRSVLVSSFSGMPLAEAERVLASMKGEARVKMVKFVDAIDRAGVTDHSFFSWGKI